MSEDKSCSTRMIAGAASGFVAGSLLGGIASNWGDIPVILRNKPWPALVRTAGVMAQHGTTVGLVGLAYSTVDCVSESIRGKRDWINGSLGGLAAGGVIGLRVGRLGTAVSAAATLAVASAAVDASGGKLTGQYIDDGATPPRRVFPHDV